MAGIKISALSDVATPALTDVFPIVQAGVTYKESATQLLSLFQSNASGTWNINISGNAATATLASTVTTNADLTGVVTSIGNATSFASMTLHSALLGNGIGTPLEVAPSTAGNVLTSDGTTWISAPNAGSSPLTTKGDLFTYSTVSTRLPIGSTDGQYLRVDSGAATGNAWSTATLANTFGASELLYSNGANTVQGLATANNGVLVTSAGGVPSISTVLPTGLTIADYLPLSGGTMTGDLFLNGNPSSANQAANKAYVDTIASGINVLPSAAAATTANLTATYANGAAGVGATLTNAGAMAAFAVDSYSASLNDRILVKNQTSALENGVYTVTTVGSGAANWVLTRATDFDQPAEILPGDLIAVDNGTINAGTAWLETATVATVGTDAINFSPFSIVTAGTGLTKTGNQISLTNPVALNLGGTNAALVASDGAVPYSTASAFAFLAPGSAGQLFQSGGAGAPNWTISTYPSTAGALNNILISDGTNWVSGAAPASSTSVIADDTATNATMYPVWVTTSTGSLPLKVTSTKLNYNPSTGLLTNMGPLGQVTNIQSNAGVKVIEFTYTASAVNYVSISNNITGSSPTIAATGSDSNIDLKLTGKGTGGVSILGVSTNSAASTGYVGEFISSVISSGSAVSLSSSVPKNITSITLGAGDWDVWGNASFLGSSMTQLEGWTSSTSATLPDFSLFTQISATASSQGIAVPYKRYLLATPTTIYLSAQCQFTGSATVFGGIYARRAR